MYDRSFLLIGVHLVASALVVANGLPVAVVVEVFNVRAPTFLSVLSGHEDVAGVGAELEVNLKIRGGVFRRRRMKDGGGGVNDK